ncbi:MAG: hypothetical protein HEP71_13140 [Roseivirga sp.]|nr:hypothetical protein [Roseivirga sp.]
MIHWITSTGKSAKEYHLKQGQISDFKSLMRTITSGRVMIISTWFRSDLFYQAEEAQTEPVLTGWGLHANVDSQTLADQDFEVCTGDEPSLTAYFQSINRLAQNWYKYRLYRKAFLYSFANDQKNPMAKTIVGCDGHLTNHPDLKRAPLVKSVKEIDNVVTKDTFSLAMRIINSQTHSN